MARGVNKVLLIGNVGLDPEVRSLPNGNAVATLSLATSESWKDKITGEKQEKTEWHRVVCFNRLGEIARDYVRKGSKLYLEGRLQTRKWQDQQGQDRYTTEIIATDIQMLDSKGDNNYAPPQYEPPQAQSSYSTPSQNVGTQQTMHATQEDAFAELDDDVPF